MQTFESTLGTATLMLASTALVLGITILILYETSWIISLGLRVYQRCSTGVRQMLPKRGEASKGRQQSAGQGTHPSGSSDSPRRSDQPAEASSACLCKKNLGDETGGQQCK